MNRIDRLFAILVMLQGKSPVRAQDLARRFEVSERTIYRDIASLYESGVPVVSLPAKGYALMPGYYLPPLVFTTDEAAAIFLGARLLVSQATGNLPRHAEHALSKVAAVLPGEARHRVESLTQMVRFYKPEVRFDFEDPTISMFLQAIAERRVVHLRYHSYSNNEVTDRELEPDNLTYSQGAWYATGYCRMRQGVRSFRLDRIDELRLSEEKFEPNLVVQEAEAEEMVAVQVRFAPEVLRWVHERQHFGFVSEQESPEGAGVVMTYVVDRPQEMLPWLLSWGASSEVLSPLELRERIRAEAEKLAKRLT
ncbi:MAG: YafY family transcriptional regulator [Chloroflexota bacterium]|nr:YafY family transcriptional regulator [Chloroflexota bacterium]MDQ5864665.1 YafY family transcriptional regulator [Chloroflexota bacterium]